MLSLLGFVRVGCRALATFRQVVNIGWSKTNIKFVFVDETRRHSIIHNIHQSIKIDDRSTRTREHENFPNLRASLPTQPQSNEQKQDLRLPICAVHAKRSAIQNEMWTEVLPRREEETMSSMSRRIGTTAEWSIPISPWQLTIPRLRLLLS